MSIHREWFWIDAQRISVFLPNRFINIYSRQPISGSLLIPSVLNLKKKKIETKFIAMCLLCVMEWFALFLIFFPFQNNMVM